MVGLLDALGEEKAVIVGHDWALLLRGTLSFVAPTGSVVWSGLSVPFVPRRPAHPTSLMPPTEEAQFYQLYFQAPGITEAELERDVRLSIGSLLYSASGDAPRWKNAAAAASEVGMVPRRGGFLSVLTNPTSLPHWVTEADVNFYVAEFVRTGFRGGLNWYRNIDRNCELMAPMAGAKVAVPALYIAGDRDLVLAFRGMDQITANLSKFVPQLRGTLVLAGCGHWTQTRTGPGGQPGRD
jgi:pimeloyl-ACP methyl ester carboxylesterase